MSITQLKALTWAASLGVAGFLGWFVYDFFENKDQLSQEVSQDTQYAVLTSIPTPEPPKDDVVDYGIVLSTWHNMDWLPAEPPPPPPPGGEVEKPKPLYKPVGELLEVLMVQVDGGKSEASMAQVRYLDGTLEAANPSPDDQVLREKDELDAPYSGIVVKRITRDGVIFTFATGEGEEARDDELVITTRLDDGPRIVRTDGAAIVRPTRPMIPKAGQNRPRTVPDESTLIDDNHWWIGKNDRDVMANDYTRILAELRFEKHRNAQGKVDGVEIKEVPEGAFASKYGVKEGQVIKSINGHPISSVNEGISFAKQNQDKYDVWTIVYEEQGKEKTKIIDTSD